MLMENWAPDYFLLQIVILFASVMFICTLPHRCNPGQLAHAHMHPRPALLCTDTTHQRF
jgi:hypothetical protein